MTDKRPDMATWTASDGYPIHVATWHPEGPAKARVVVLHGVQSHQGWYHGLGRRLAESGYETHFPDRRGSGSNQKDRGDTPSADRLIRDVREFLADRRAAAPKLPAALVGISWGGKLAVLASRQSPDLIQAMALVCPGLQPRVGVSLAEKLRIAWAYLTRPTRRFPIPLGDPELFTSSAEGQNVIATDPLSIRSATARMLAASTFIDRQVSRAPRHIHQPALLMLAGHDRIVDNRKTQAYFDRLASPHRRVIEYPEAHHTLEFEPDPDRYARDLAGWLDEAVPGHFS